MEKKLCKSLDNVQANLESKVQGSNAADQLSNQIKEMETSLFNNSQKISKQPNAITIDTVTNITLSLASDHEQKEKEKRQFNVILHNLSETTATDGTARKQDDMDKCSSLFSTYIPKCYCYYKKCWEEGQQAILLTKVNF